MQEVLRIGVIVQELLKNIMYNKILKVIAQEVLKNSCLVQELLVLYNYFLVLTLLRLPKPI